MDISNSNIFSEITVKHNKNKEFFANYKSIIEKLYQTHTILVNKNTSNIINFSISLDLLFFNKQQIDSELNFFTNYYQNILKCVYQDLYSLIKQLIISLHNFESKKSEIDFLKIKIKDLEHYSKLPKIIDFILIKKIVDLIKEYYDEYSLDIENLNIFIESNYTNKQIFDLTNVIVNLKTQYNKYKVDLEGIYSKFSEILASHLLILSNYILKIEFCVNIVNESNHKDIEFPSAISFDDFLKDKNK